MPTGIFISYRRDDARDVAGRLHSDLVGRFGQESIFRDIESISPGDDFHVSLQRALDNCKVMLVLIGSKWLDIADEKGQRRLDNPEDWIRLEVATALQRTGIKVVPVLVEGAPLPSAEQLPEELRPLKRRQALLLSDVRWRGDLQALVDMLAKIVKPPATPLWKRPAIVAPGAIFVLILTVVSILKPWQSSGPHIPRIGGLWRSPQPERTYEFTQAGNDITITLLYENKKSGAGNGRLEGRNLKYNATWSIDGDTLSSNCDMTANQDFSQFDGRCDNSKGETLEWTLKR